MVGAGCFFPAAYSNLRQRSDECLGRIRKAIAVERGRDAVDVGFEGHATRIRFNVGERCGCSPSAYPCTRKRRIIHGSGPAVRVCSLRSRFPPDAIDVDGISNALFGPYRNQIICGACPIPDSANGNGGIESRVVVPPQAVDEAACGYATGWGIRVRVGGRGIPGAQLARTRVYCCRGC